MRDFQTEVDLGKARAGGSSTDASAFWDLLDPPMMSKVIAAGFGDYAAGLRRTQPRFPPNMRYALMERWNDCTHKFIFGFGEMTLTPADYTTITGLGFDGPVAPLDARYQTVALGAELVRTLLGVPTCTRYTAQGYVSYEVVYRFWAERIRTRLAAWRELPEDVRPVAPAYTREERDQAARSFIFYLISSQLLCTSQNKGDPAVLAYIWTRGSGESNWQFLRPLEVWAYEYWIYPGGPGGDASADTRRVPRYLAHRHHTFSSFEDPDYWRGYLNDRALSDEGEAWEAYPARCHGTEASARCSSSPHVPARGYALEEEYDGSPANIPLSAGDYATYFSTRLQARLPEVREYIQDRKKHRTRAYCRAQAEAEAEATASAVLAGTVLGDVPFPSGMEVALDPALDLGCRLRDTKSYTRGLALPDHTSPGSILSSMRGYDFHDLEIGRLRRHQSRQSSAVTRLQMEVDRLRTRLEVEGIPLDFSEDEEDDDDGSSYDDAPPAPPS
ncbi:hypothetical protein JCGZ_25704 [Jatropha curcas]|uniref:Aminotransferase-like plant mobile domain-containing protein n=1 Tax=Jatropha curcas TaxID=180498 RepID=A0A067JPK5_JATCU|nr:hypothetical protein JCGZ_25704 [Jatropha curcas]